MSALPDRILDAPLDKVEMSSRLRNCLKNQGYGCLRDYMIMPDRWEREIHNCGNVTRDELTSILAGKWTPSMRANNALIVHADQRTLAAIAMREKGMTFDQMGKELGVSPARAAQIFDRRFYRFGKMLPIVTQEDS